MKEKIVLALALAAVTSPMIGSDANAQTQDVKLDSVKLINNAEEGDTLVCKINGENIDTEAIKYTWLKSTDGEVWETTSNDAEKYEVTDENYIKVGIEYNGMKYESNVVTVNSKQQTVLQKAQELSEDMLYSGVVKADMSVIWYCAHNDAMTDELCRGDFDLSRYNIEDGDIYYMDSEYTSNKIHIGIHGTSKEKETILDEIKQVIHTPIGLRVEAATNAYVPELNVYEENGSPKIEAGIDIYTDENLSMNNTMETSDLQPSVYYHGAGTQSIASGKGIDGTKALHITDSVTNKKGNWIGEPDRIPTIWNRATFKRSTSSNQKWVTVSFSAKSSSDNNRIDFAGGANGHAKKGKPIYDNNGNQIIYSASCSPGNKPGRLDIRTVSGDPVSFYDGQMLNIITSNNTNFKYNIIYYKWSESRQCLVYASYWGEPNETGLYYPSSTGGNSSFAEGDAVLGLYSGGGAGFPSRSIPGDNQWHTVTMNAYLNCDPEYWDPEIGGIQCTLDSYTDGTLDIDNVKFGDAYKMQVMRDNSTIVYEGYSADFTDNSVSRNVIPKPEVSGSLSGSTCHFNINSANASQTHTYKIRSIDAGGNFSTWSEPKTLTINTNVSGYAVLVDGNPTGDPGTSITQTSSEINVNASNYNCEKLYAHVRTIGDDGTYSEVTNSDAIVLTNNYVPNLNVTSNDSEALLNVTDNTNRWRTPIYKYNSLSDAESNINGIIVEANQNSQTNTSYSWHEIMEPNSPTIIGTPNNNTGTITFRAAAIPVSRDLYFRIKSVNTIDMESQLSTAKSVRLTQTIKGYAIKVDNNSTGDPGTEVTSTTGNVTVNKNNVNVKIPVYAHVRTITVDGSYSDVVNSVPIEVTDSSIANSYVPEMNIYQQGKNAKVEINVDMDDHDVLNTITFDENRNWNFAFGDGKTGNLSVINQEGKNGTKALQLTDTITALTGNEYTTGLTDRSPTSRAGSYLAQDYRGKNGGWMSTTIDIKSLGTKGTVAAKFENQKHVYKSVPRYDSDGELILYGQDVNWTSLPDTIKLKTERKDTPRLQDGWDLYITTSDDSLFETFRYQWNASDELLHRINGQYNNSNTSIRKTYRIGEAIGANSWPGAYTNRKLEQNSDWQVCSMNYQFPSDTSLYDFERDPSIFELIGLSTNNKLLIDNIKFGYASKVKLYRDGQLIEDGTYQSDYVDTGVSISPNKVEENDLSANTRDDLVSFNFKANNKVETHSYQSQSISNYNGRVSAMSAPTEVTLESNIAGYAVKVDNNPISDPGSTINNTTGTVKSTDSNGLDLTKDIYIHVRAIDQNGQVSEVTHKKAPQTASQFMKEIEDAQETQGGSSTVSSICIPEVLSYQTVTTENGMKEYEDAMNTAGDSNIKTNPNLGDVTISVDTNATEFSEDPNATVTISYGGVQTQSSDEDVQPSLFSRMFSVQRASAAEDVPAEHTIVLTRTVSPSISAQTLNEAKMIADNYLSTYSPATAMLRENISDAEKISKIKNDVTTALNQVINTDKYSIDVEDIVFTAPTDSSKGNLSFNVVIAEGSSSVRSEYTTRILDQLPQSLATVKTAFEDKVESFVPSNDTTLEDLLNLVHITNVDITATISDSSFRLVPATDVRSGRLTAIINIHDSCTEEDATVPVALDVPFATTELATAVKNVQEYRDGLTIDNSTRTLDIIRGAQATINNSDILVSWSTDASKGVQRQNSTMEENGYFKGYMIVSDSTNQVEVPFNFSIYKSKMSNDLAVDKINEVLSSMTLTNDTTESDILNSIYTELSSYNADDLTISISGFEVTEATEGAGGHLNGTVTVADNISGESASTSLEEFEIAQQAQTFEGLKELLESSQSRTDVTNDTTLESLLSDLRQLVTGAEGSRFSLSILDRDFDMQKATVSSEGNLKVTVTIADDNAQMHRIELNYTINKLNQTLDDLVEHAEELWRTSTKSADLTEVDIRNILDNAVLDDSLGATYTIEGFQVNPPTAISNGKILGTVTFTTAAGEVKTMSLNSVIQREEGSETEGALADCVDEINNDLGNKHYTPEVDYNEINESIADLIPEGFNYKVLNYVKVPPTEIENGSIDYDLVIWNAQHVATIHHKITLPKLGESDSIATDEVIDTSVSDNTDPTKYPVDTKNQASAVKPVTESGNKVSDLLGEHDFNTDSGYSDILSVVKDAVEKGCSYSINNYRKIYSVEDSCTYLEFDLKIWNKDYTLSKHYRIKIPNNEGDSTVESTQETVTDTPTGEGVSNGSVGENSQMNKLIAAAEAINNSVSSKQYTNDSKYAEILGIVKSSKYSSEILNYSKTKATETVEGSIDFSFRLWSEYGNVISHCHITLPTLGSGEQSTTSSEVSNAQISVPVNTDDTDKVSDAEKAVDEELSDNSYSNDTTLGDITSIIENSVPEGYEYEILNYTCRQATVDREGTIEFDLRIFNSKISQSTHHVITLPKLESGESSTHTSEIVDIITDQEVINDVTTDTIPANPSKDTSHSSGHSSSGGYAHTIGSSSSSSDDDDADEDEDEDATEDSTKDSTISISTDGQIRKIVVDSSATISKEATGLVLNDYAWKENKTNKGNMTIIHNKDEQLEGIRFTMDNAYASGSKVTINTGTTDVNRLNSLYYFNKELNAYVDTGEAISYNKETVSFTVSGASKYLLATDTTSLNVVKNGWVKTNNQWQYVENSKLVKNTWKQINGKWYKFDNKGYYMTGWQDTEGYLQDSGELATGWTNVDGRWYHFSESGKPTVGWLQEGGKWYYLSNEGQMKTGWIQDANNWYYLGIDGVMKTGWLQSGDDWYYLENSGRMLSNTTVDGYVLGANGKMLK